MNGWARKTDKHHAEIRDGLRDAGFKVRDTSSFGGGFPDLLVLANVNFVLFEIKSDPSITHRKDPLTEKELMFFELFHGGPVYIVHTLNEALERLLQNQ